MDTWHCVLRSRRFELPNISMLVETVLSVGVSNGFVESCFSFLTALLSDRRLCMTHDTMADLLLLRANHLSWSETERTDLIAEALNQFMSTRRKLKLDDDGCKSRGTRTAEPPAKVAAYDDNAASSFFTSQDESSSGSTDASDSEDSKESDQTENELDESDIDRAELVIVKPCDRALQSEFVADQQIHAASDSNSDSSAY